MRLHMWRFFWQPLILVPHSRSESISLKKFWLKCIYTHVSEQKKKYNVLALKLEQEGSSYLSWKEWKENFPIWNYKEWMQTVAISKIKHVSFISKPTFVLQENWKWVLDTIWQLKQPLYSNPAVPQNRTFYYHLFGGCSILNYMGVCALLKWQKVLNLFAYVITEAWLRHHNPCHVQQEQRLAVISVV